MVSGVVGVARLVCVACIAFVALLAPAARASISLPVTWDALVRESSAAVVVTPKGSRTVWEDGHICTYTQVHVDRSVAGALGVGADAWVRTLGGVVGKVGQLVDGEAVFVPGHASLVFLRPGAVGSFDVTARAQGQYPVVPGADSAHPATVIQSHGVGLLVQRPEPAGGAHVMLASEVLHGRPIDDAAHDVAAAWTAAHAH
jgi:hypothetical protein